MAEKYKQYILDFRLHDGTTHSVPFNVPIGDPGVHFGSDHPPDTATVWVDPNGEPTSTEDWDFTLYGGTTETKRVVVVGAEEENGHSGILRLKDANGVWREIPALVGPRGFRGEKGVPGVYVGSDAPPEDAMVWVNPDGEPTSTEDWEFAMEDGSRDTKRVVVVGAEESNGYSGILMVRQEDGSWKEIPAIAGSKVNTDTTLTKSGVPADAKTTGDKLVELSDDIPEVVVKTIKKVETEPGSNESVTRNGFSVEVIKTKTDGSVSMSGGTVFDGVSPHIGANGNWFIGAVDTGVPAKGKNANDYVLPVGGDNLGGVKNGGNVVINADGTMNAPNFDGKSDFMVQDTAPEDTSVLWVDPTDDNDDGFAGISVTGAKVGQTVKISAVDENGVPTAWEPVEFPNMNEPNYEQIEVITLAEEVAIITKTIEPDGTPYNFRKLVIKAKLTPVSANAILNIWVNDNEQAVSLTNAAVTGNTQYSSGVLWVENGFIRGEGNIGANSEYTIPTKVGVSYSRVLVKGGNIYNVSLVLTGNQLLQPGSVIEIWGVRA